MYLPNRRYLPSLLLAAAAFIGCSSPEPVASEGAVEAAPALLKPFAVQLKYSAEGDGPFEAHSIVDGPTANLAMLESHFSILQGGASSHDPHTHRAEEIIFPIDGDVEIYRGPWEDIAESRERIGPGQFIFHASNHLHAMSAIGPGPSSYWVMQWEGGPTGADDHILPPSTFDYRTQPQIEAASGIGSQVLTDTQTPNAGRFLAQSMALAPGALIPASAKSHDTVLITLTDGIKIRDETLTAYTVAFYPADTEFGVENTSDAAARYISFAYSK